MELTTQVYILSVCGLWTVSLDTCCLPLTLDVSTFSETVWSPSFQTTVTPFGDAMFVMVQVIVAGEPIFTSTSPCVTPAVFNGNRLLDHIAMCRGS